MEFGVETDPEMNFNPDYEIASEEEDCNVNTGESKEIKEEDPTIESNDTEDNSSSGSSGSEEDSDSSDTSSSDDEEKEQEKEKTITRKERTNEEKTSKSSATLSTGVKSKKDASIKTSSDEKSNKRIRESNHDRDNKRQRHEDRLDRSKSRSYETKLDTESKKRSSGTSERQSHKGPSVHKTSSDTKLKSQRKETKHDGESTRRSSEIKIDDKSKRKSHESKRDEKSKTRSLETRVEGESKRQSDGSSKNKSYKTNVGGKPKQKTSERDCTGESKTSKNNEINFDGKFKQTTSGSSRESKSKIHEAKLHEESKGQSSECDGSGQSKSKSHKTKFDSESKQKSSEIEHGGESKSKSHETKFDSESKQKSSEIEHSGESKSHDISYEDVYEEDQELQLKTIGRKNYGDREPENHHETSLDELYADMSMDGTDFKNHQAKEGSSNLDLYSEFVIEEASSRLSYDQLLKDKNINLLKVEELKSSLQKVIKQENAIKEENLKLRRNISSLYKTAQTEIKRKDKEIAALIRKLDYLQPMRFQALMYRKIVAARSQGKEGKEFDEIIKSTLQAKELSSKDANSSEVIQRLEASLNRENNRKDSSHEKKQGGHNYNDEHKKSFRTDSKRENRSNSRDKSSGLKETVNWDKEHSQKKKSSLANDVRQRNRETTSPTKKRSSDTEKYSSSSRANDNSHNFKRKDVSISEETKLKERKTESKPRDRKQDETTLKKHEEKPGTRSGERSSSLDKKSVFKSSLDNNHRHPLDNECRISDKESSRKFENDKRKPDKESNKSKTVNEYDSGRRLDSKNEDNKNKPSLKEHDHSKKSERDSNKRSSTSDYDRGRRAEKESIRRPDKDTNKSMSSVVHDHGKSNRDSKKSLSSNERDSKRSSSLDRPKIKEQEKKGPDRLKEQEKKGPDRVKEQEKKVLDRSYSDRFDERHRNKHVQMRDERSFEKLSQKELNRELEIERRIRKREKFSQMGEEKLIPDKRLPDHRDERNRSSSRDNDRYRKSRSQELKYETVKTKERIKEHEKPKSNEKRRGNLEEMNKGNEKESSKRDEVIKRTEKGAKSSDSHSSNKKERKEHTEKYNESSTDKKNVTKKDKELHDSKSSSLDTHGHGINERKEQKFTDDIIRTEKKAKRSPVKKAKFHQLPTLRHLEHDDSSSENDVKESYKNRKHNTNSLSNMNDGKRYRNSYTKSNTAASVEPEDLSLSDIDSGSDDDTQYFQTDKSKLDDKRIKSIQKYSPKNKKSGEVTGEKSKTNLIQKADEEKESKERKPKKDSIKHSSSTPASSSSSIPKNLKDGEKGKPISKPTKKKLKTEKEKSNKDDVGKKKNKPVVKTVKPELDDLAKTVNISTEDTSDANHPTPSKSKDEKISRKRKRKEKEISASKVKAKKMKNSDKQKSVLEPGSVSSEEESKIVDEPIEIITTQDEIQEVNTTMEEENVMQDDNTMEDEDNMTQEGSTIVEESTIGEEKAHPEEHPVKDKISTNDDCQLEEGELSEGEIKSSDSEAEVAPEYPKQTSHRFDRGDERRRGTSGKSKDLRHLINKRDGHKRSKDSYRGEKSHRSRSDRY